MLIMGSFTKIILKLKVRFLVYCFHRSISRYFTKDFSDSVKIFMNVVFIFSYIVSTLVLFVINLYIKGEKI